MFVKDLLGMVGGEDRDGMNSSLPSYAPFLLHVIYLTMVAVTGWVFLQQQGASHVCQRLVGSGGYGWGGQFSVAFCLILSLCISPRWLSLVGFPATTRWVPLFVKDLVVGG